MKRVRAPGSETRLLVVGVILTVGSALVAWLLLTQRPRPSWAENATQPAVVFVTDLALPAYGEGFGPQVSVAATVAPSVVSSCSHAEVEVYVDLTNLRERPERPEVVVEPNRTKPVRFALAISNVSDPTGVKVVDGPSDTMIPVKKSTKAGNKGERVLARRRESGLTLITGRKALDWPAGGEPDRGLSVAFNADWTEGRRLGSCYVRLPALVGGPDVEQVARVARDRLGGTRKALANYTATTGMVVARSGSGLIEVDATTVQPTPTSGFATLWRCAIDRARTDILAFEGDRSITGAIARGDRTCAAQATVTNARVRRSEVFLSFVLAAVFSFGLGVVYDVHKARRQRAAG